MIQVNSTCGAPPYPHIAMIPLSDHDITALREALHHEHRCAALYDQVIGQFGATPPFRRIRDVAAAHIAVLEAIHARYGLRPTEDTRRLRAPDFGSLAHACEAAIESEVERGRIYLRLRAGASDPLVVSELRNLERASRDAHLPALRALAKQLARRKASPPAAPRRVGCGPARADPAPQG